MLRVTGIESEGEMPDTCKHEVRDANAKERTQDCCGDRYESRVRYVCGCGKEGCRSCMEVHLMEVHLK